MKAGFTRTLKLAAVIGGALALAGPARADGLAPASARPLMVVTPLGGFAATGVVGGPISPLSQFYVVSNAGPGNLSWSVTRTSAWFGVVNGPLTLAAGLSSTSMVTVVPWAVDAQPGFYSETIRFRNLSGGLGDTGRVISLQLSSNTAPVTIPQEIVIDEDGLAPIVLNGFDLDEQSVWAEITQLPERGSLYQSADGVHLGGELLQVPTFVANAQTVIFRPWRNESGNPYAQFRWRLLDGLAYSEEAVVTVRVNSLHDAPQAAPDRIGVLPGQASGPFDVLANDGDADGDTLTLAGVTDPQHGRVDRQDDGRLVYTPGAGFNRGEDHFSYTVEDATGLSSTGLVSVHVGALSAGDWPMPGGGPQHSGYYPGTLGAASLEPRWWAGISNAAATVAIADGAVYVTSSHQPAELGFPIAELHALDLVSGQPKWRSLVATQAYVNPPAWSDGRVYVQHGGGQGHRVVCFDGRTGAQIWATALGTGDDYYRAPLATADGIFVKGHFADGVHGLGLDGAERFFTLLVEFGSADGMHWSPSYQKGTVYCWDTAVLHAVDAVSGDQHWSVQPFDRFQQVIGDAAPAIDGDAAFAVSIDRLLAFDLKARTLRWSRQGEWEISFRGTPAVGRGVVYVRGTNGILAFRATDGAPVREYVVSEVDVGGAVRSPIVTDDALFASYGTNTYVFGLAGELRQTIPFGGELAISRGTLVINGSDGFVRAYAVPVPDDLSMRTVAGPVSAPVWNPATVTFIVTNTGPATATGVRFSAPLPALVPFLSASSSQGGCGVVDREVQCDLGAVVGPSGVTVSLAFLPTNLGTILVTGRVQQVVVDAEPGNQIAIAALDVRLPSLEVDDIRVMEGQAGVRAAAVELRLSATNPAPVICRYAFDVGGPLFGATWATAMSDFYPTSGVVIFPAGVRTQVVAVAIQGDPDLEPDETFAFSVTELTNAVFEPWRLVFGTIVNDDAPPSWKVSDASVAEGAASVTNAMFTVSLWPPGILPYSVLWRTVDGTARSGMDYLTNGGRVYFAPGETSQVVRVSIVGDRLPEPDETFQVQLLEDPWLLAGQPLLTVPVEGTGRIGNDDELSGVLDRFVWDGVAGPQYAGRPFDVAVTAVDGLGHRVESFNGTALARLVAGAGEVAIGGGEESFTGPFGPFAFVGRCTSLYLASELGRARRLRGVAIEVAALPEWPLDEFTVRLQATPKSALAESFVGAWEGAGWTTVYQASQSLLATGWVTLEFTRPFEFGGTENLLLDLSFMNRFGNIAASGSLRATAVSAYRSVQGYDVGLVNPREWAGSAVASPMILNVKFFGDEAGIMPGALPFTNGLWAGPITVLHPVTNATLHLEHAGRIGESAAIDVGALEDLALSVRTGSEPGFTNVPLRYFIGVTNHGTHVSTGVTVLDQLPPDVQLLDVATSQGGWSREGSTVRMAAGALAPGAGAAIEILVLPQKLGVATNRITLTRAEPEFYVSNNLAVVRTEIRPAVFLSVSDADLFEGADWFSSVAVFVVTLNAPAGFTDTVTVSLATSNGTARAAWPDDDYSGGMSTLTFAPGVTQNVFYIPIHGDSVDEPDEVFYVHMFDPVNATIVRPRATGTIRNDDWSRWTVGDFVVVEGNDGLRSAVVPVTLNAATWRTSRVHFATADVAAAAGSDYEAVEGWLEFPPGTTSRTVEVPVHGDRQREQDELFELRLDSADGAVIADGIGRVTIRDDEPPGLSIQDEYYMESSGIVHSFGMTAYLSALATNPVSFDYFTVPGSARAGEDFIPSSGRLTIPPGDRFINLPLDIVGDRVAESMETFSVVITNVTGADPERTVGLATIWDDDGPPRLVLELVTMEDSLGDRDGIIEPGEVIRVWVKMRSLYEFPGEGARATLTSLSPMVTVLAGESDYGPIVPDGLGTNREPFVVRVKKEARCGQGYPLQVVVSWGENQSTNFVPLSLGLQRWLVETVDAGGEVGQGCSLALDANDRPHVSYYDATARTVKYATKVGTNWVASTISPVGVPFLETSLALDPAGRPRVVYAAGTSGLALASFTGTGWETETIPGSSDGVRPSLVLSNGQPRVAFYDFVRRSLRFSRYDEGQWITETVDDSGDMGRYSSLALHEGQPRIAYSGPGSNGVRFAAWMGTIWLLQTVTTANGHGVHPALGLTEAGLGRIGYSGLDGHFYHAEWNGTDWSVRLANISATKTPFTSLKVDSGGVSQIAFHGGGSLRYDAIGPAGALVLGELIDGDTLSGAGTNGVSLALDSKGRVVVAYHFGASNDLRIARRSVCDVYNEPPETWDQFYAVGSGGTLDIRLESLNPDEDPTLSWSFAVDALRGSILPGDEGPRIRYFAPTAFSGIDRFQAVVNDGWPEGTATAQVTIEVFSDEDGDGMEDEWETQHGLDPLDPSDGGLDDDGDGISNRDEYRARTDPADRTRGFRVVSTVLLPDSIQVVVTTEPGRRYRMVRADAVTAGAWSPTGEAVAGTGGEMTLNASKFGSGGSQYYRVEVIP